MMGNCSRCYYFTTSYLFQGRTIGVCHRYPSIINVHDVDNGYCGEYKAISNYSNNIDIYDIYERREKS